MPTKALITSCSNKFFPSMINLLTSIKVNYPNHPHIYVYDLGLLPIYRFEIEKIENVTLLKIPTFCPHWRSCYTWKTYIFNNPKADLNFYIDAGCQVLKPLDEDFAIIEHEDLLLINIPYRLDELVPPDYLSIFSVDSRFYSSTTISAGMVGFKSTPKVMEMFKKIYDAGVAGLTLGFSPDNTWRNKGKDKNPFTRNAKLFRHDQSLLNLFYRLCFGDTIPFQNIEAYNGDREPNPKHRILHLRLTWKFLEYTDIKSLHKKPNFIFSINRLIIYIFSLLRQINLTIKKSLGRI